MGLHRESGLGMGLQAKVTWEYDLGMGLHRESGLGLRLDIKKIIWKHVPNLQLLTER